MKKYLTNSPLETQRLGAKIIKEILKRKKENTIIFALNGELGAGKTTFLKGMAKGLGIKEAIISPTFLIVRKFPLVNQKLPYNLFYHIDCYRIERAEEILNLEFKKIIKCKNIVAIEWGEKIKKFLPPKTIWIFFKILDKRKRELTIKY